MSRSRRSTLADSVAQITARLEALSFDVVCFIDTVCMYIPFVPRGVMRALVEANAPKKAWRERVRRPDGSYWGYVIIVQQPTPRSISILQRLAAEHEGILCRVDLATDFLMGSEVDMNAFRDVLLKHMVLKYRPKGPMHDDEGTVYFVSHSKRREENKLRANRDAVIYSDRPSKVTGIVDCVHLEIRFQNAGAVSRAGIESPIDLFKLNPRKLLERQIRLSASDLDQISFGYVQRTVRADRLQHLKHRKVRACSAFADRYRSQLPKKTKDLLHRLHKGRVQLGKEVLPIRLKNVGPDILRLPSVLYWRIER